MHLHVRDETVQIVRSIHFRLNLTSHRCLDNGCDFARLLPFCLPDSWPVLWQTIIVKECAHVTVSLLSQQRQYLFADSHEVADAAFVAGLAYHLGMKRQAPRSQVRSERLLNDGALGEALDHR